MDDGVTEIKDLVFSNEEQEEEFVASKKQRVAEKESEKTDQCSNGGVMSNLISAFGLSRENKEEENGVEVSEKIQVVVEEEGEKEGGILSGLLGNLVSPRAKPDEGDAHASLVDVEEKKKSDDNGGIFNNLISGILHPNGTHTHGGDDENQQPPDDHNQAPISDDSAPASDEASILIHSIVHD